MRDIVDWISSQQELSSETRREFQHFLMWIEQSGPVESPEMPFDLAAGLAQTDSIAWPRVQWMLLAMANGIRRQQSRAGESDDDLESLGEGIQLWPNRGLRELYSQLTDAPGSSRGQVLQILMMQALHAISECQDTPVGDYDNAAVEFAKRLTDSTKELQAAVELIVNDPPSEWEAVAMGISPLFQVPDWPLPAVFPRLLDAIEHRSTAAVVLDLASYVYRSRKLKHHPAHDRSAQLVAVLGAVVDRLGVMEEDPQQFGSDVESIQKVLNESIALAVSLSDTLSTIGDKSAIGNLNKASQLSHRRLQTEAAGALARLGDEEGKNRLLAMVAEPVARLRVIAYGEELGFADQIDENYTSPTARAESDLAIWLSQPHNLGLAPTSLELVDQRTQYWPSFDEPQTCYLFRFNYELPSGIYSNVGIAGPLTHACEPNVADLPVDDIYAIYAGWQAEHEDIYDVPEANWNIAQREESRRLAKYFDDAEIEIEELIGLTFFFGERALVIKGKHSGVSGFAITDGGELLWQPTQNRIRPLGIDEVVAMYKGRKMLRTFNP